MKGGEEITGGVLGSEVGEDVGRLSTYRVCD